MKYELGSTLNSCILVVDGQVPGMPVFLRSGSIF